MHASGLVWLCFKCMSLAELQQVGGLLFHDKHIMLGVVSMNAYENHQQTIAKCSQMHLLGWGNIAVFNFATSIDDDHQFHAAMTNV